MIVVEEEKVRNMLGALFRFGKECEWNDAIEEAMNRFVNLPTFDAETVVHCGECKYYPFGENNKETRPWCKLFVFKESGYCSYGKRRTDADE